MPVPKLVCEVLCASGSAWFTRARALGKQAKAIILGKLQHCTVIVVCSLYKIEVCSIGVVHRQHPDEDVNDRDLISRIGIGKEYADGLAGIEDWSHLYVIYWMDKIPDEKKTLLCPGSKPDMPTVGIFATRAPVRPNPIGLTLVELLRRERNVLVVKGLDALDGTPVLDIKPYPYWVKGRWIVVTKYKTPAYFRKINK
jgi:tRNA-Thr(GGU) m(6)t(6)A37 methyltransferase TsaA